MNDGEIAVFLSLAKTQSFSATARELHVSKQHISRVVQKLERELGFPLFLRDKHAVTLTEGGAEAVRVYREYDIARRLAEFQTRRSQTPPKLVLGLDAWVGMADGLSEWLYQFGRIRGFELRMVHLDPGAIRSALEQGRLDGAMTSAYVRKQMKTPCLALPLEERPLGCHSRRPGQLRRLAAVSAGESEEESRRRERRLCMECGLNPEEIIVVRDQTDAIMALELGNAAMIHPLREVRPNIVRIPLERTVSVELVCPGEDPVMRELGLWLRHRLEERTHE